MPAFLVLDLRKSLALDRLGDDHRRLARRGKRLPVGAVDRHHVVPVDHDREAPERLHPATVHVHGPAVLRLAALAEPVDIQDRGEVGQLVVPCFVQRLPDRTFGQLGVAAKRPDVVRKLVQVLPGQGDADRDRQPLPQGAGCDVHPGDGGRRVPLQPRAELAKGHHLGVCDRPDGLEHRVAQRRRVSLGVDQVVVVRILGLRPVVLEIASDEDRDQVRGGHRGGRVP